MIDTVEVTSDAFPRGRYRRRYRHDSLGRVGIAAGVQVGGERLVNAIRDKLTRALIVNKGTIGQAFSAAFGKAGKFNTGPDFRVGIGGSKGEFVFRVAGRYLGKIPEPIRRLVGIRQTGLGKYHWDWYRFGRIPKIE